MSFDPSTAQPLEFDPSSAQPEPEQPRDVPRPYGMAEQQPAPPSGRGGLMGMLDKALGLAEVIGSVVSSGTTGMLKGGLSVVDNRLKAVTGQNVPGAADAFEAGVRSGTYQPRTEEGQDILQGPVMREIAHATTALGPLATPVNAARGARAVQQTKVMSSPKGLARIDEAIKTAKLAAPENEGIKNAIDAGYKLTPKAGKAGRTARTAQTAAGSARLEQELSAHNAEVTARLARKDVGLPDDVPLTRDATESVRKEAGADYDAVKDVGRVKFDEQLNKDLDSIVEPYLKAGEDYEVLAKNPIIKSVEGLRRSDADTASVVEVVKDLRNEADKAFRAGDKKLGRDYRAASAALDNAMDRAISNMAEGRPDLADAVSRYKAARVRIAKSYLLDDALDGKPGEVNAKVYARALKKNPNLLTGDARAIGEFGMQFGDEGLAKKAGKSGHIGMTYHDILLAALHPGTWVGAASAALARPAARAVMGSDWSQRRMRDKAARALPPKAAPVEPQGPAPLELAEGPLPTPDAPPGAASPLGDLTPDWETAPGAAPGSKLEVVPTEGLVQAVDEAVPMRPGAASPAVRRGAGSEIPAVPGRPDLPDTMIAGAPAEVAGDAATGARMLEPDTQLAMRNQRTAENIAKAEIERALPVPKGEATEIKPQVVEPAGAPKYKEPAPEKLPVGEATEIKPESVKPAGEPAKVDERLAGLERMRANEQNETVRKVIDKRIAAVKKELADEAAAQKRRDDAAELRRTAAITDDPELKAALYEEAKAIEKADAIPTPKTAEGQPDIKADAPKKIPAGKAKELTDEEAAALSKQDTKPSKDEGGSAVQRQTEGGKPAEKGGTEAEDLADLDLPRIDEAFLDHQQRAQAKAAPAPAPAVLERGRRQVRAALEKGKQDGTLGKDEAELALWALDKNPNLARGLRFEMSTNGEKDPARAVYNTVSRIVKSFTNKESDPQRAVHEILHHSERMMPPEVQRGINREWRRALEAEIKKAKPEVAEALRNIQRGIAGGQKEFEAMKQAFADGVLSRKDHYHLTNPSEFWAVNASRILAARHTSRNAWQAKAVQWTKEMIERVKDFVGLRSDAPVLRALDEILSTRNEGVDRSTDVLKTGEKKSMLADEARKADKEQRRAKYRAATGSQPSEK